MCACRFEIGGPEPSPLYAELKVDPESGNLYLMVGGWLICRINASTGRLERADGIKPYVARPLPGIALKDGRIMMEEDEA